MTFPVVPVVRPTNLAGQSNGRLDSALLVGANFPGRPLAKLHAQTARSWNALAAEVFRRFGATLTCTSTPDAYRSYAIQERTFRERYVMSPEPIPGVTGTSFKTWLGQRWYKRIGVATSATPGTSNHGWGLAIDACYWTGSNISYILNRADVFDWLLANAATYGFSWELQSEPWHIRLVTGDVTPKAVLEFEKGPPAPVPPPLPPDPVPPPPPPPPAPTLVRTTLDIIKTTLRPELRDQLDGNQDVVVLQSMALGLYHVSGNENLNVGPIDGDFGPRTQAAAKVLQALAQVPVDGIVGPVSWRAILNADGV